MCVLRGAEACSGRSQPLPATAVPLRAKGGRPTASEALARDRPLRHSREEVDRDAARSGLGGAELVVVRDVLPGVAHLRLALHVHHPAVRVVADVLHGRTVAHALGIAFPFATITAI